MGIIIIIIIIIIITTTISYSALISIATHLVVVVVVVVVLFRKGSVVSNQIRLKRGLTVLQGNTFRLTALNYNNDVILSIWRT